MISIEEVCFDFRGEFEKNEERMFDSMYVSMGVLARFDIYLFLSLMLLKEHCDDRKVPNLTSEEKRHVTAQTHC